MSFKLRIEGAVALLSIDNPARGNALTPAMMAELASILDKLAGAVGALVLRGSGDRVFCAGYDLSHLGDVQVDGDEAGTWADRSPELMLVVDAVRAFPAPIIACLNGHAIGGGALLASLCDLRVARPGVRFQVPAARIGVMYPLQGLRRMVALIGLGRAAHVLLLGDSIDTERGTIWGLYDDVVPAEEVEARALEIAGEIAANAPLATAGMKALLNAIEEDMPSDAVAALHASWTQRCLSSTDLAEGIAAARERRPPAFSGR